MLGWVVLAVVGGGLVVWGAETFAEHLAVASVRLGVSAFALAVLLAGAEPEELATVVTASLRRSPGIAIGDVVGANVAMLLVALGLGAVLAPLPLTTRLRRYGLAALAAGALGVAVAWDGRVGRGEGVALVAAYAGFVAVIWRIERRPPAIGEVEELDEARERAGENGGRPRAGRELVLVVAGVVAMAGGASLLVEAVRRLSGVEETQLRLGLVVVGFATAFELVVLAWSTARRGATDALLAAGLGSFTYNVTMTLGAGGLARPLRLQDAGRLHVPSVAMLAALALVLALGWRGRLGRAAGAGLLALYAAFAAAVLII